jgi:hypothetical protein
MNDIHDHRGEILREKQLAMRGKVSVLAGQGVMGTL